MLHNTKKTTVYVVRSKRTTVKQSQVNQNISTITEDGERRKKESNKKTNKQMDRDSEWIFE